MSLYREFKRRKVFRVAVVYAATAFAVLQAADLLSSGLGLPDWVFRAITVAVVVGFPVALVLAWAFELTPEGVRRTDDEPEEASPGDDGIPLLGKRTVLTAGALVVLGIGIGAGWFLGSAPSDDGERSIAVLAFSNLSADPENAFFAEGISEEVEDLLADPLGEEGVLGVRAQIGERLLRRGDQRGDPQPPGCRGRLVGGVTHLGLRVSRR